MKKNISRILGFASDNNLIPVFLLLVFLLIPAHAFGAESTFAWDANTESDIAGYKIYYGTASGNYTHSVDVGNTTGHTQTGLQDGVTYYFASTAYDTAGNESEFSTEIEVDPSGPQNHNPDPPDRPAGPSSGYIQTNYSYSTSGTDPDGDSLEYQFDWGDGEVSGWNGASSRTHAFAAIGNFCVKAQARDSHGATSGWSQCLDVGIALQTHTITASAGANGSMTPAGSVTVNNGANQEFSINPNQNYRIADVRVDSASVGAVSTYTFNSVTQDHTITATFAWDNQPPIAHAGADQSALVNDSVTLDGGGSSDADGNSLSFSWSFVSIPDGSTATLSDTAATTPGFVVDAPGSYVVQLIVNDGTVNSAADTITVSTNNSPPVANAGADQSALVNDSVTLDGGGSSDADGNQLSFSWSFVSIPDGSTATLSDTAATTPGFVVDAPGSYVVQLIVNDGTVNSAADTITVSTNNSPPVANAGADQSALVNDSVTLDGGGSSDADGNQLTFSWSFVSIPGGSTATLSDTAAATPGFVVDAPGSYVVQLIVNDGTVNSAADTITVSTNNSPPVANAGADQSALVNDSVTLDGGGSSDADGNSLSFSWSFVSIPDGSSATLSDTAATTPGFVVDAPGSYVVQLIVNDGSVNSAPDTITVSTNNSPPVANAGADQSALVNDSVTLDGGGSSDADGNQLTFSWSFVSIPDGSSATLSDTAAATPGFVVDAPGSYVVQLIVNDGTVNSAPDTITVSTNNSPPVANAGADQSALVNDSVTLDGSGSSDADGNSLSFSWSFVSIPGGSTATLSDTAAATPGFVVDAPGSYVAQLIVNDGSVNSAPDTITVSTNNSPPVANAGADQSALVNDTVTLDGGGSSDADGNSLSFSWSFVSIPGGSTATLSDTAAATPGFVVDAPGSYVVQLIVNDGSVNSAPDTITVSTNNSPPVANAGADQSALVNDSVTLDGGGSSDADGNSLSFSWSFVSIPGGSTATLSDTAAATPGFVVDAPGSYVVQLIVNDGSVNSAPDTITVSTNNSPPVANAGADQSALVNDTVTLDGGGSSDADGNSLSFSWSFVSIPGGSTATLSDTAAATPGFVVDAPGSYVVQLIVNDGSVNSAPDTITVSTNNSPPVANAGADQSALVNDTVTLDGSGSSDADGNQLTFSWSFVSIPDGSSATLSSTTAATPGFVVDAPGSYVAQLIVNDGTVNSAPDTITVSTNNSPPVANAGADQSVVEGDTVTISGAGSFDPDDNIDTYSWNQINGPAVTLTTVNLTDVTFTAPDVDTDGTTLTFQLTLEDSEGLQAFDSCIAHVIKAPVLDSDSDGVPDDQDAFPSDPTETTDNDQDGIGDNADPDDDNDTMPDTWETQYGLDPLADDASGDEDGDDLSNLDEFLFGTDPIVPQNNLEPEAPTLDAPKDQQVVELIPVLQTGAFIDPNFSDFHAATQWQIHRASDNVCVFDITSEYFLTQVQVPMLVLNGDENYVWQARHYDNHGIPSPWSGSESFTTLTNPNDNNTNGIPDDQELATPSDLDGDGDWDSDQNTIKCVQTSEGKSLGISFKGSSTVVGIQSIAVEEAMPVHSGEGDSLYHFPFGLINFKLIVDQPGDLAEITVYFSEPAPESSQWFKYDPIEATWTNYSEQIDFSEDRHSVTLYLEDGGELDADGIANGIIVDPAGLGVDLDNSSASNGSGFGCFISTTAHNSYLNTHASILRKYLEPAFPIMLLLIGLIAAGRRNTSASTSKGLNGA